MMNNKNHIPFLKKILFLSIITLPTITQAQHNNEFYNKGELVTVQAGAEIYIQGDMHHYNAASTFNNNGLVEVQGHAYSDVNFQQRGSGILRMFNRSVNLTEAQNISGSYAVRGGQAQIGVNDGSFYTLQLANRTGLVQLSGTGFVADVRGSVDFKPVISGFTLPTNRIRTHTAAAANGANYPAIFGMMNTAQGIGNFVNNTVSANGELSTIDNAYIEGKLRRAIANTGGAYGYPMGLKAGTSMGEGLQYNTMSFTANNYDYITGYFQIASDNTIAGINTQCSGEVTWFSGTNHGEWIFTSGRVSTEPYSMTIYPQHYVNLSGDNFFITKDNAIQGTANECGPQPEGLTRSGFTGFSEFGFASGTGIILAHKLIDIKATAINNEFINVKWEVEPSDEVFMYEVERSVNAIDFNYIGDLAGIENQAVYTIDDTNVSAEIQYYYRVKSIFWNGSFAYSPIVTAKLVGRANQGVINIYPNPTQNNFNVSVDLNTSNALTIRVYDVVGRVVHTENYEGFEGINQYMISAQNWSSGMYYVQILGNDFSITKELIKSN